jgi:predicted P-loop ATPase
MKSKKAENSPEIERVERFISTKWQIRFNEISVEFEYKTLTAEKWEKLNENNIFRQLQHENFRYSMSNLVSLMRSDFTKKYNPFLDYFTNLPIWNGDDNILKLTQYLKIGEKQEARLNNQLKKWLVRSIACSFGETFNKQSIVIIGGQNNGKSSFLRWLCPPPLRRYYKEDIGTDKDSMIAIAQNFIINIDELSTLQKKDLDSIKSLMSKESINVRIPYDRTSSLLTRRCNFVASTDKHEFLTDEAGSVRWICFAVDKIDWSYKTQMDINSIWAQAYHLYKSGKHNFNYQLTREEIKENEEYNLQFYIKGDEHEALLHCFNRGTDSDHDEVITATEAIEIIKGNRNFATHRYNSQTIGRAFRFLQFEKSDKYIAEKRYAIKGYYVKFKPGVNRVNSENSVNEPPY